MRELISAAIGVVSRRFRFVLVVVVGVAIPAQVLIRAPELPSTSVAGEGVLELASVALVAGMLADLQGNPLTTFTLGSILRATLRTLASFLVAGIVSLPILIPALLASRAQSVVSETVFFDVVFGTLIVVFAPIYLLEAVCLQEKGGPWWTLKRAWSLSRPRRGQVRLVFGGLWLVGLAIGTLHYLAGPIPLAIQIVASAAQMVLDSALVAVLYVRLVREEPSAPLAPLPVRSRKQAAAGTFHATHRGNNGPRRKRR